MAPPSHLGTAPGNGLHTPRAAPPAHSQAVTTEQQTRAEACLPAAASRSAVPSSPWALPFYRSAPSPSVSNEGWLPRARARRELSGPLDGASSRASYNRAHTSGSLAYRRRRACPLRAVPGRRQVQARSVFCTCGVALIMWWSRRRTGGARVCGPRTRPRLLRSGQRRGRSR
jgi:hypothetical protein